MKIINTNSPAPRALAVLAVVIAVAVALLASVGGDVAAYQPHGLSISEVDMPDPPCPYGHDDGCEDAHSLTLARLHQPSDPHAQLPHAGVGGHRMEQNGLFKRLPYIIISSYQSAMRQFRVVRNPVDWPSGRTSKPKPR